MKYKTVLVPFPFDDFSTTKVRPALCLTQNISSYNHLVICFITSQIDKANELTDLPILAENPDFTTTGLKVNSALRLHRLVTIPRSFVLRELDVLPTNYHEKVKQKLIDLFEL